MVGGNGLGLIVLSSSLIEHGAFGGYKVDLWHTRVEI